jgi:hypothetical protein
MTKDEEKAPPAVALHESEEATSIPFLVVARSGSCHNNQALAHSALLAGGSRRRPDTPK